MRFEKELNFAMDTASKAGKLLMNYHGKQNEPEWATPTNFKIVVDKMSDDLIFSEIRREFPEDDIYSEERNPFDRGRSRKWVYDPVDGTIPYTIHQSDNFSVAIGLVVDETPILGIVYMPKRDELYRAIIGEGSFCNGYSIRVSEQDNINRAVVGLDEGKETIYYRRTSFTPIMSKLNSPEGIAVSVRSACASACLCQVASGKPNNNLPLIGRLEAYLGHSLEPWDMAATVPIIREAGGIVTHFSGEEWKFSRMNEGDPSILAANSILHKKLVDLINV